MIGRAPSRPAGRCASARRSAIGHVWMTAGLAMAAVGTATAFGREHGIAVIDGGCPCMFGPTADPGHKAMRLV